MTGKTLACAVYGTGWSGTKFEQLITSAPGYGVPKSGRGHTRKERYGQFKSWISDPAVDILVISTPPQVQISHAFEALRNGKHLIVEKPVGMNPEGISLLAREAAQRGLRVAVPYHLALNPLVVTMRKAIQSSRIGTPVHATFRMYVHRNRHKGTWLATGNRAGGPIYETLVHGYHLVELLIGPIHKIAGVFLHGGGRMDESEGSTVMLVHEGGATSCLDVSWLGDAGVASGFIEVIGSQGTASVHRGYHPKRGYALRIDGHEGYRSASEDDNDAGYRVMLQSLLRAIIDKSDDAICDVGLETAARASYWARETYQHSEGI